MVNPIFSAWHKVLRATGDPVGSDLTPRIPGAAVNRHPALTRENACPEEFVIRLMTSGSLVAVEGYPSNPRVGLSKPFGSTHEGWRF
jgi:hypothetical protein